MSALRAGAARACLTPPLGTHLCGFFSDRLAEDVGDDLFAKALVLAKDDTTIAIVVCDLIAAYQPDFDRAKARAHELTGIPVENIFMSCTHTHYGPASVPIFVVPREDSYMEWAMDKAGDAVKLAYNRLRPAKVGHASGQCPEECHNRRWHMKDGSVQMNPGYQNPEALRPAGPTDPEVGVLAVLDESSAPIAVLANYSLHYVGGPYGLTLSADYFGAFDRALQRMAGSEFVGIMMNGCCGDINNCDFTRPAPTYPHPFYQVERVANAVASRAFGAWQQIREYDSAPVLAAASGTMPFTRRESTPEELAAARKLYESKNDPSDHEWTYARELVLVSEEPVTRDTPINSLRVGDLGITGVPGEVFVQIGLAIKESSPFARTFVGELANDYAGYIPTDKALQEGSYETRLARSAKAAPGTQGALIAACLDSLKSLA